MASFQSGSGDSNNTSNNSSNNGDLKSEDEDIAAMRWREIEAAVLSTAIYCDGLMGFGCEVPATVKLIRPYLSEFFEEFIYYCQDSIHRIVAEITRLDLANNNEIVAQSTEDNENERIQKNRRAIALCLYVFCLRCYCTGEETSEASVRTTVNVKWSMVRKIVEDEVLSLPAEYLRETKVKTISGCIMSSKTLLSIMQLNDLLGSCLLYSWYENDEELKILCPCEEELEAEGGGEHKNRGNPAVIEILASIEAGEFAFQPVEFWIEACERDTALFASSNNIDRNSNSSYDLTVNAELLGSLWNKCKSLLVRCSP